MRLVAPAVLLTAASALAQQPGLSAAVVPGRTETVVRDAAPGSLCLVVLGLEAAPVPLPGGATLGLVPVVVAGLGYADDRGLCAISVDFPIGAAAGATFLAQAVVLAPGTQLGAPGALTATPVVPLQVPERGSVADVVVLFGQSNMEGHGAASQLPTHLQGPLPRARIWNDAAGAFAALTAGVNNTASLQTDRTGPEMALAHELSRDGATVYMVKLAVGQTSLGPNPIPGPWNEWGCRAGELYDELLRRVDAACAGVRALGLRPRVRAIFFMQGESDAVDLVLAAGYYPRLLDLVTTLRSDLAARDLGERDVVPFVLGLVNQELAALGALGVGDVRAAQAAVAAELPRCATVETTGMPLKPDGVHLSTAGVCALGHGFAAALRVLLGV